MPYSPPETTFIYGLADPRTGEVRYIGKADNPPKRLKEHLEEFHRRDRDTPKNWWLRSLEGLGLQPVMVVLDEVLFDDWQDVERQWIDQLRVHCRLLNARDGGAGWPHHVKLTPVGRDRRERLSAAGRRYWDDPEHGEARRKAWGEDRRRRGIVPPINRGEDNNHAKLTAPQVVAIRERHAAGERQFELAAEYGVRKSSMSDICSGRVWKHVGGPTTPKKPKQRLSDEDVADIRDAYSTGEKQGTLAMKYGVTQSAISNIVNHKKRISNMGRNQ